MPSSTCRCVISLPLLTLCPLAAREEAGLKIGTDRLPILFVVSLFCTCLASPAASALIAARRPGQGQQIVLHGFAVLLAGGWVGGWGMSGQGGEASGMPGAGVHGRWMYPIICQAGCSQCGILATVIWMACQDYSLTPCSAA
jgi:hypothetical protein